MKFLKSFTKLVEVAGAVLVVSFFGGLILYGIFTLLMLVVFFGSCGIYC